MRLTLSVAALLLAAASHAQQDFEFWPNADYDPSIPTVESVLGHAPGERITWHRDAIRYFRALESAQPDRIAVVPYARSWQGRELVYVIVTSAANMQRIDAIKSEMQSLRNALETSQGEADRIIESAPAVTWLGYGIHGNEISSTDASMLTAYHLLAARNDDRVEDILRNTVVIIDPVMNPDGRDRFIHHFETAEGLVPSPLRIAAEHDEPWPYGRGNHYLFDLNRDWFAMTQPETQGRIRATQEWIPVVVADIHEMGGDSTYFFAPGAPPVNPHLTPTQIQNQELYGRTNAYWFDRFGIDYFIREEYDEFYSGYTSWTMFFGATGMTYEQGSVRGLTFRQYDGNELPYAESVRNHFVTSLGTAETVAKHRGKLLQDLWDYQVSAIAEGRSESIRSYIIPRQADQAGANRLAGSLVQQGVAVGRAEVRFSACGENYAAGSYVIDMAQPAKRLVRTLLDADVPMDEDFIARQERRRALGLDIEIYDVTAWSLPLMMNVRADSCNRLPSVDTSPAGPDLVQSPTLPANDASVAYLVPWGEATAIRFLAHALRGDLAVKSSDLPFTLGGNRYPAGTLIIDVGDNPADVHATVREIAAATGANIVAVDDSWVTAGPSLGSNNVVRHNPPDVAMAWDEPTTSRAAGQARFVIERQFDYPVTAVRSDRLASADLGDFEVLILPAASGDGYGGVLGDDGADNLRDWVRKGGVLIGLGTANRYLADASVDLISIRRENAVVETDEDDEARDTESDGDEALEPTVDGRLLESIADYNQAITPQSDPPDYVYGVIVRADLTPEHWLGAGVASSLNVLAGGSDIYTPIRLDSGVNVARFAGPDELLLSGYLWEENRRQLAYKPFAVVQPEGRGFVVAFTQDPTTRAYLDGLNVILANAIFRGAAHARPLH